MSISIVVVNAGEMTEARRIARDLVDSRLAASVNLNDRMRSYYRWDGTVHERGECQLLVKTRTALVAAVISRVRELHSYRCPAVIALPVADGNPEYLDWVMRETRDP